MITDDKKSILERVNFFCAFFIWSDPNEDQDDDEKIAEEEKDSRGASLCSIMKFTGG